MCVTVALHGGRLWLEVADGDPCLPCVGPNVDPEVGMDAESGRGLLIVNFLVGEAGGRLMVVRAEFGKVVRVRIPCA
ncbi:hypothetical protein [Streptomyces sp. NPDC059072]|uniref:hypothetical protein n=1 Tax=Streptomyces sp. NPDC059072 TaxID=3346715 RepID=UPI0036917D55